MDMELPESYGATWKQIRRLWVSHLAVVALLAVVCLPHFPLASTLAWSGMILAAAGFEGFARVRAAGGAGRWRSVLVVAATLLTSFFYAYTASVLMGRPGGGGVRMFGYILLTSSMTFVLLRYYRQTWFFLLGILPQTVVLLLLSSRAAAAALAGGDYLLALTPVATATLLILTFWAARTHLAGSWKVVVERERAARAASRAKSEFLATMSHEIRTPLNGVLGMAQAMGAEELAATQRERLKIIRRSGENLLAILDDVLDLSKIESGQFDLEVSEFDLEHMVRGAAANFAHIAQQSGVAFEFEVGQDAKGLWRGDAGCVRRVLYQLVSNAVKFTHQGEVRIRADRSPDGLRLTVSDTGVGIAAEDLDRLFEKFVQADGSYSRRHGGVGVGLAITRQLVQLMGGRIEVASKLGQGSAFAVTLPLERTRDAAAPEDESKKAVAPAPTELRVLAAEDNKVNQMVLKALLAQAAIEPVIVENGLQAVKAWEDQTWDIILMDIQMPEMDGVAAMRAIRAREAETGRRRTPIMAVTANAMVHQVAEYDAAGADGLVPKPIEVARLFAAMEAALEAGEAEETAAA